MNEPGNTPPLGRSFETIKADLSQKLLDTKKPTDFIITLVYCVPILAPVRVCLDAGIFVKLAQAGQPLGIEQIVPAADHDVEESRQERIEFMVRMLRAGVSLGLADECTIRTYCANELTVQLADPGFAAGFELLFDGAMGPQSTMTSFLSFHQSQNYSAASTASDGPWQRARDAVGTSTFEYWMRRDPIQLTRLSSLMQRMQGEAAHWTEWFPGEGLFASGVKDAVPFLVDVGGGRGHDVAALARMYSNQDIQLILQDQPSVIEEGIDERERRGETLDSRIALSKHDFFQKQTVQSAGIYYMHKIMHDWPDRDCVTILARLRDAMAPTSRIFVNDVILPDKGASLLHTAFDIDMLALHSGQERDETSWKKLIEKVGGLEVRKFWHPPDGQGEGVVEVGWKDRESDCRQG